MLLFIVVYCCCLLLFIVVVCSNVHVNNELMEQLGQLQDKVSKLRQLLKVATLKILEERSTLPANLEG